MNLLTVDLSRSMTAENRKVLARDTSVLSRQAALDREAAKLAGPASVDAAIETQLARADQSYRSDLMQTLGLDYKLAEAGEVKSRNDQWAHLPQDRIFTRDAIKRVCIRYGLRFLPTSLYKGALDEGIGAAMEDLKRVNHGKLPQIGEYHHQFGNCTFMIAAPAESFVLSARPKDPLLFCCLGGERYYLIHKWGADLSVARRVVTFIKRYRVWPMLAAYFWAIWHSCAGLNGPQRISIILGSAVVLSFGSMILSMLIGAFGRDMPDHPFCVLEWLFVSDASQWNSPFKTRS